MSPPRLWGSANLADLGWEGQSIKLLTKNKKPRRVKVGDEERVPVMAGSDIPKTCVPHDNRLPQVAVNVPLRRGCMLDAPYRLFWAIFYSCQNRLQSSEDGRQWGDGGPLDRGLLTMKGTPTADGNILRGRGKCSNGLDGFTSLRIVR